jgi:UDP-glucose:(glucosyl)LPS alpha-1,2-glucosyltransferase
MGLIAWNEYSEKSNGGTEMCARWLEAELGDEFGKTHQIIPSRVRELDESRYRVYWLHDLPWDPETSHLKDQKSRERFHQLVFCGNWQRAMYHGVLGVPADDTAMVIDTPSTPIPVTKKDAGAPIRLVYTSTPQRGLDILVPVFVELCKKYDNIQLDVFSSFDIYGWVGADAGFADVFKICREHPKIIYHGTQSNEVVRKHLESAHIFAYPSTWLECNSRSLIEAMSAKLICVHSDYGGLVDTSGSMTCMYPYFQNPNAHAARFYTELDNIISNYEERFDVYDNYTSFVKQYADMRFNPATLASKWRAVLDRLPNKYGSIGILPPGDTVLEFKI